MSLPEFKKLSEEELSLLSINELNKYLVSLSNHNCEKAKYEWQSKSSEEKEKQLFSDIDFYIARRGIEGITLEEEIEVALKIKSSEHSYYGGTKELIDVYQNEILTDERFTFFWETKSPFSQWHKSFFTATTLLVEGIGDAYETKRKDILNNLFPYDVQSYSSSEQFMMYHKAMIFFDRDIATEIMSTHNVRKIKELGRKVKNFDKEIWQYYRSNIVFEGNKAKFEQNEDLKQALLATKGTTLVEAAPNDKIWGIGLTEDDPKAQQRETWQGKNLLGEILTKIRIEIAGEY